MADSATLAWTCALIDAYKHGQESSPRGKTTRELIGYGMTIKMDNPIVSVPERELGTAFLCAEPAWILSGDNTLEYIHDYARLGLYSDDGIFLSGAYGPKIVDQLPFIVKCLLNDQDSRQAIINIWREKPASSADTPCTLSYQFVIRQNRLHMIATMRSNDVYLGTPYDIFTQVMIAYAVCLLLKQMDPVKFKPLALGELHLNVGSFHLYESNFDKARTIVDKVTEHREPKPLDFDYSLTFADLKDYLRSCALWVKSGNEVKNGFLKGLQPKNG